MAQWQAAHLAKVHSTHGRQVQSAQPALASLGLTEAQASRCPHPCWQGHWRQAFLTASPRASQEPCCHTWEPLRVPKRALEPTPAEPAPPGWRSPCPAPGPWLLGPPRLSPGITLRSTADQAPRKTTSHQAMVAATTLPLQNPQAPPRNCFDVPLHCKLSLLRPVQLRTLPHLRETHTTSPPEPLHSLASVSNQYLEVHG